MIELRTLPTVTMRGASICFGLRHVTLRLPERSQEPGRPPYLSLTESSAADASIHQHSFRGTFQEQLLHRNHPIHTLKRLGRIWVSGSDLSCVI